MGQTVLEDLVLRCQISTVTLDPGTNSAIPYGGNEMAHGLVPTISCHEKGLSTLKLDKPNLGSSVLDELMH